VSLHRELHSGAADRSFCFSLDGAGLLRSSDCYKKSAEAGFLLKSTRFPLRKSVEYTAIGAGWIVGAGTLFRPEAPILLLLPRLFLAIIFSARKLPALVLGVPCHGLRLLDDSLSLGDSKHGFAGRTAIPGSENSNLPGELVPYGFMAWEKTWLYRVRDCYWCRGG